VLLCFIDPRVRKIKNEAFRCPGIFSRTLRFYSFASSPCSPWLQHSATHCYTQPMGPTNVLWAGPRSINPLNYLKKMILTYDLWLMIYILHQQDRVPIMIWSTKSCLLRIFLHKFFLRRILFTKKSCFRPIFCHQKISPVGRLISVSCLVYQFIGIENDSNSKTQWSQRHNL